MKNVHVREMPWSVESLGPWIERCWSGTADDAFPRDLIRSWRQNPPGVPPQALIPGVTRVGHGLLSFRFEAWDGRRWRVRVESADFVGWHGFDLESTASGCRITHTIDLTLLAKGRVMWAFIEPIHDWVVESLFDRLQEALASGVMPATTRRKASWPAALALAALRRVARLRTSARV